MNIIDWCVHAVGKLLFGLGSSLSITGLRIILHSKRNLTCRGCGRVHESEYEQLTHRCDAEHRSVN